MLANAPSGQRYGLGTDDVRTQGSACTNVDGPSVSPVAEPEGPSHTPRRGQSISSQTRRWLEIEHPALHQDQIIEMGRDRDSEVEVTLAPTGFPALGSLVRFFQQDQNL